MEQITEFLNLALAIASIILAIIASVYSYVQNRDTSKVQQDTHEILVKITERVERIASHSSRQVDRAWEYVTDTSRKIVAEQHSQQQQEEARRATFNQEIVQTVLQMLKTRQGHELNPAEAEDELLGRVSGLTDKYTLETRLANKIGEVDRALIQYIGDSLKIIDTEAKDCSLKSISEEALAAYKEAITIMNRLKDKKTEIAEAIVRDAIQKTDHVLAIVLEAMGRKNLAEIR